jgi:dTDP-4-dehydrorhamnose 3,5-epimerase
MEVIQTGLKGCVVIKADLHGDHRGFFLESFNKRAFKSFGINFEVAQINFAKSSKNVLRGLHYQKEPMAQSKLVGVISGAVIDTVVDIRPNSETFLKNFQIKISDQATFLLVPKGFAHGYYTLEDDTVFYYAVDDFYSKEHEDGIRYNDPDLNIDWQLLDEPQVSEKDLNQELIKHIKF